MANAASLCCCRRRGSVTLRWGQAGSVGTRSKRFIIW
jgi:hypothetical protein